MVIQRDDTDERESRLNALIEQFRAGEKRSLLKRGIRLWTRTETQMGIARLDTTLPPKQVN